MKIFDVFLFQNGLYVYYFKEFSNMKRKKGKVLFSHLEGHKTDTYRGLYNLFL